MKIISWDIGQENLAYCIFEDEKIIRWKNIDFLDSIRHKKYICNGLLKNGDKCKNNSQFFAESNNNRIYYCSLHKKQAKSEIFKYDEHEICNGINKNGRKCAIKAYYYDGENNKYYCKRHGNDSSELYITPKNATLFQKSKMLYQKLIKEPDILDVDYVLIENQPVHKNPKMKSIQMLLYSYYLLKSVENGMENNNKIREILLFNATGKLKIYDGPEIKSDIKDTHARNKFLAIQYCPYFLKNDTEWLNYFNNHKKKDDLADCYLQGLYFFKKI